MIRVAPGGETACRQFVVPILLLGLTVGCYSDNEATGSAGATDGSATGGAGAGGSLASGGVVYRFAPE